eukprot:94994_1
METNRNERRGDTEMSRSDRRGGVVGSDKSGSIGMERKRIQVVRSSKFGGGSPAQMRRADRQFGSDGTNMSRQNNFGRQTENSVDRSSNNATPRRVFVRGPGKQLARDTENSQSRNGFRRPGISIKVHRSDKSFDESTMMVLVIMPAANQETTERQCSKIFAGLVTNLWVGVWIDAGFRPVLMESANFLIELSISVVEFARVHLLTSNVTMVGSRSSKVMMTFAVDLDLVAVLGAMVDLTNWLVKIVSTLMFQSLKKMPL